jgi:hypothetical protein
MRIYDLPSSDAARIAIMLVMETKASPTVVNAHGFIMVNVADRDALARAEAVTDFIKLLNALTHSF